MKFEKPIALAAAALAGLLTGCAENSEHAGHKCPADKTSYGTAAPAGATASADAACAAKGNCPTKNDCPAKKHRSRQ